MTHQPGRVGLHLILMKAKVVEAELTGVILESIILSCHLHLSSVTSVAVRCVAYENMVAEAW